MTMDSSLTVTRRPDEAIALIVPPSTKPATLTVAVSRITGNQVRLNCKAPRTVSILRRELIKAR